MNSTTVAMLTQLESSTRVFRNGLAQRHRAKWLEANRRARVALDHWEPEPLGLVDKDTGEIHDELPAPVVNATHAERYSIGRTHGALTTVVPVTKVVEEQHPVVDSLVSTKASSVFTDSTTWVREQVARARSMSRWHVGRDNGQKYRFKKLDQCGSRVMIAQCGACHGERKPVEEGCGIARLCERCSLRKAKKRRARFGRARQRVSVHLNRLGCLRTRKLAGKRIASRWTDKMLTLTLPHFLRANVDPERIKRVRGGGSRVVLTPMFALARDSWGVAPADVDTTMMRVLALRAAWPIFARKLRTHWKQADEAARENRLPGTILPWRDGAYAPPPMHRAFEWTPGGDGLGHPHYHVWLLCPWLCVDDVAVMWTEALREAGLPVESTAIVTLQRFESFDRNAVGELIKAGDRRALEWSRLYKHGKRAPRPETYTDASSGFQPSRGPANAFEYADGWTIAEAMREASPGVVASLYCALEGMRLTQASAGFFSDDEPAACTCKAQGCWHIRFEPAPEPSLSFTTPDNQERAPPC